MQKWCYFLLSLWKSKRTRPSPTQLPPSRQDLSQLSWTQAVEAGGGCQGGHKQFCSTLSPATYEEWGKQICPGVLWWAYFLCVFFPHRGHLSHKTKKSFRNIPPEGLQSYDAMLRKITENYLVGLVFSFWMLAALLLLHMWRDLIDQTLKHKRKPQRIRKKRHMKSDN